MADSKRRRLDVDSGGHTVALLSPSVVATTKRLPAEFYNLPAEDLAKSLLGKVLVRSHTESGRLLTGRIVETEAYLGGVDRASHSFNGKITNRTKPMFMAPGTIYVYLINGIYHCLNISSKGDGAAVLIADKIVGAAGGTRPDGVESKKL